MDFSLDDLLDEVEGALKDTSPPQEPPPEIGVQQGEGGINERRPTPFRREESLGSNLQEPALDGCSLFGTGKPIVATERSRQAPSAVTAALPSTVPTIPAALGVDFDSDSSPDQTQVPGATALDVDFDDDPVSPESTALTTSAVSAAVTNGCADPGPPPGPEAVTAPEIGADFDSDSSPVGEPAPFTAGTDVCPSVTTGEMAASTEIGMDFDVGSPPAVTVPVGEGFDEDDDFPTAATASNGGIGVDDKLLRSVSPGIGSTDDLGVQQPASQSAADGGCFRRRDDFEPPPQQLERHDRQDHRTGAVPSWECGKGERVAGDKATLASTVPWEGGGGGGGGGAPATTLTNTTKRRCGTVFLGGATANRGYCASSLSQRACDNLRCTDCNFEVLRFNGQVWEDRTDYMFLRNNAPDKTKLGERLQPCADGCAYACQCCWQNVEGLRALSPTGRPRWACGGH